MRLANNISYDTNEVPFYGTSESHSVSQSVAIKAGFAPAWAEVYTREIRHEVKHYQ